ncbi:MAG: glycosyltransferase, partial [Hyphomicrobiales bacterium]|nr:glycosyltransferase [Hyphomicrobiales bacterium]
SNVTDALRGLGDRDLVMVARTDDEWADGAATILAVAASRDEADVLYADEELASNGRLHPRFKPDWSPILAERADLFGRAWAARVGWLRAHFGAQRVRDLAGEPLRPAAGAKAFHVARPLLRRADAPAARFDASVPPAPAILAGKPFATLIIPTRDRAELLSACVASLDRPGGRTDYHAIVVDNGSVTDEADRLFDRLRADARFEVMRIDAPFNYSALCNAAAARARADALVFLNNDVEARSSDWLADIVRWTPLRGVGAVGARLLYPGGTLQHGGVVLGIDGQACHFERGGDPSARGFFDRADAPHEISAVTAACLAVERAKFEAVGGFDARNLPVEYSDIDLCLRLGERGWGALMAPAATLVHREAATRKVAKSQESRYAAEVAHFRARWAHVLRADPYFHPALSLDWHSAALG